LGVQDEIVRETKTNLLSVCRVGVNFLSLSLSPQRVLFGDGLAIETAFLDDATITWIVKPIYRQYIFLWVYTIGAKYSEC
jgi:hypothetical protein